MNEFTDEELIARLNRLGDVQPAPEATLRALNRVRSVLTVNTPLRKSRIASRFALAAAILLAVGGTCIWLLPSPTAQASFADVQAAIQSSQTMSCRQLTRTEGKPDETVRVWCRSDGLIRSEESNGAYNVSDTAKFVACVVDPKQRTATLRRGLNMPKFNPYEQIKNLPNDASARALPGKKIDGKDALGFAVTMPGSNLTLTVWANPQSRRPVRIEGAAKDADGKGVSVIIDDFVFDEALDAKLFSMEPPIGYQFKTEGVAELPAAPTDPLMRDLIVTPLVGIGPVKFGMSREDVERLLGKPDGVQVNKNGYAEMSYASRGFSVGASKTSGVVQFGCMAQKASAFRIRDFGGKTDKGIALGASTADIIRAYGVPDEKESNKGSTYLTYRKLSTFFTLFDDRLVTMSFMRPRPAK